MIRGIFSNSAELKFQIDDRKYNFEEYHFFHPTFSIFSKGKKMDQGQLTLKCSWNRMLPRF